MKAATPETHDLEAAVPAAPASAAAIRLAEAVAAVAAAVAAAAAARAESLKAENPKAMAEKAEEEKKQLAAAVAAVEKAKAAAAAAEQKQKPPAAKKVSEEEDPRLRWAFVRKVYAILSLQFVLTAAVAATAYLVGPIPRFFVDGPPAAFWATFIVILVSPLIVMFPMLEYREKKRRRNLVLLALFTLCCSFSIALSAATITVDIAVLQVTILTVLGLTLFTIWGAKMGYDFSDIYSCLLTGIIMTLLYIIVETPFPLKMVGIAICVFLVTLVLSGFVVVVYICDIDDKILGYSDDYN